jgi:nickel-dependent lactate racemase
MKLNVHYGDKILLFRVPQEWKVLAVARPENPGVSVEEEETEIKKALDSPIGTKSLSEIAKKSQRIVILCTDFARPTPSKKILPLILDYLNERGLDQGNISLMIATGTHPPPSQRELEDNLGDEIISRVRVFIHDSDNSSNLEFLGVTQRGTPVWINRTVLGADLKIGVGGIFSHHFAGFSGGAKIILPGVAGRKTTAINHLLAMEDADTYGKVENPVKNDMIEAARMSGLDFIVNVVLDEENRIMRAFAGDPVKAHLEGVNFWSRFHAAPVPRETEVALTSGYPFDKSLVQSTKGLMAANRVTKKGGTIIHLSPIYEDIPTKEFRLLKDLNLAEIYSRIKEFNLNDPVVQLFVYPDVKIGALSRIMMIIKNKDVIVVTQEKNKEPIEQIGLRYASSIDEAILLARDKHKDADLVVFPAGGDTMPLLGDDLMEKRKERRYDKCGKDNQGI